MPSCAFASKSMSTHVRHGRDLLGEPEAHVVVVVVVEDDGGEDARVRRHGEVVRVDVIVATADHAPEGP